MSVKKKIKKEPIREQHIPFEAGDGSIVVRNDTNRLQDTESGKFVSTFREEYITEIQELSKQGFSINAIAGHLGVSRRTILTWTKSNPRLKHVYDVAKTQRQFFWEKTLIEAESGPKVQAAAMSLRALDAQTFNDRLQVEVKVEHEHKFDINKLSADELKALIAIQQKQQVQQLEYQDAEYEDVD